MNILQINSAKNFGGGEKHLLDLADGLAEAGHKIFFVLRCGNHWDEKLNNIEFKAHFLLPLRNAFDLLSAWRLAKIIKQNKIDIIHAHVARDYPLAVLAAQLSGSGVRVVLTRHVLFPLKSLHKILLAKTSAVIAVSQAVEKQLTGQKIFPPNKIRQVSNALNLDELSAERKQEIRTEFRRRYHLSPEELLVTTIGELKSLKGQADFLRAAEIILTEFPGVRFALVGQDISKNQAFRKSLEFFAQRQNLAGKILWLDFLDDVSPVLCASDVFVSASHSESFGMAILEAMTTGNAVVATKTAGACELLQDEESGKLVSIKNAEEIARAVGELLKSENLRRRFGQAAKKAARSKFSFTEMINSTEQIYFECIKEGAYERTAPIFGDDAEMVKFNNSMNI